MPQTELASANRVAFLEQLLASIAEINQPICAVVMGAEAALRLLLAQPTDTETVRRLLARIVKDGMRTGDIVSRTRALIEESAATEEINAVTLEAIDVSHDELVMNGVSVQMKLAKDLPLVRGDRVQLLRVTVNLIINAIEAMSPHAAGARDLLIRTAKTKSGGVRVTVRDSGPGVDPANLERIFDAHFTTKADGLGMGLSICRAIIQAHGGRLSATRDAAQGTIVQFTLPAGTDRRKNGKNLRHALPFRFLALRYVQSRPVNGARRGCHVRAMGGDRAIGPGIHLPTGIPLSPVQEALTISTPKHRLGARWAVFHRGGRPQERAMIQAKSRKLMHRRAFLKASSTTAGAIAVNSQLSERAAGQSVEEPPTFRRPKTILPVPTPSPQFQQVEAGVPDTQLTREAAGLLREFSTPVLINHSHRVFFWANEMGRQTGQKFDAELLFICAAFHDLGLVKKFSSDTDRFEVDSANAVRQFLEHHGVPSARIQTAWDAIALHTTPGIAAYKPLEVELLYNGVALDSLGVGYETFPAEVRTKVVTQFPRVNFKQQIAEAFFHGFEHKPETTVYTCNEDICSHFIRNYKHSNFYDQVQNSPFQNSV